MSEVRQLKTKHKRCQRKDSTWYLLASFSIEQLIKLSNSQSTNMSNNTARLDSTPLREFCSQNPLFGPFEKFLDPPLGLHLRHSHGPSRRAIFEMRNWEPIFFCLKLNIFGILAMSRDRGPLSVGCHGFLQPIASIEKKETTGWPNTFSSRRTPNSLIW